MIAILKQIENAILEGSMEQTMASVREAIAQNLPPATILREAMTNAMEQVGIKFEEGEYYVPEMLLSARAMQAGLVILKPLLIASDIQPVGRIILATVAGDLHDIGKNLVGMMLEGAGFEVIDLGTDVSPADIVTAVKENQPDLVGLSALLTTTMPKMEATIQALVIAGCRDQVKVMIGGAPVTESYSQHILADGYAPDASRAVVVAKNLISIK